MENLLSLIEAWLANYGIIAVFLLGVLEEVLFIIPSSLMFLATGFFLIDHSLSFWAALASVLWKLSFWGALGITVGSFFIYGIFYWGGKAFLDRYGRYLGISWAEVEKIEKKFSAGAKDEIAIFVLRALPFWSITIVSAFCGLIRLSWKTFGFYTFLGSAVRIAILGMAGWELGGAYDIFGGRLLQWEKYGTIFLIVAVVAIAFYFFYKNENGK